MVTEADRQIIRDAVRNNDPLAALREFGLPYKLPRYKHLRRAALAAFGADPNDRAHYLDVFTRAHKRGWHSLIIAIKVTETAARGLRHRSPVYQYNAIEGLFAICAFAQTLANGAPRSCGTCEHYIARSRKPGVCALKPGLKWSAGQAETVHADCPLVQIRGPQ